jgi:hypothetical protein
MLKAFSDRQLQQQQQRFTKDIATLRRRLAHRKPHEEAVRYTERQAKAKQVR